MNKNEKKMNKKTLYIYNFELNFCYENKFYCKSEKKKYIIEFNRLILSFRIPTQTTHKCIKNKHIIIRRNKYTYSVLFVEIEQCFCHNFLDFIG